MSNLPVIVGFGGINSAGRSSFHHAYRRLVIDKLPKQEAVETYTCLATMMGYLKYEDGKYIDNDNQECLPEQVPERFGEAIRKNTLVRRIGKELFDADRIHFGKNVKATSGDEPICFTISKRSLPEVLPENWDVRETEDGAKLEVKINGGFDFTYADKKKLLVQSGGQLPGGFDPGKLYNAKNHPRGLKLNVYGASDAVQSLGIDWDVVKNHVRPDQIGVYSASSMGQLDNPGAGGYLKAQALGKRTSSKQLPLSFAEMPADFVNAYLIGNFGFTGAQLGACATLLYNLAYAMKDIREGRRRIAIVGSSEAPLEPEVIEGYRVMSALGEDSQLLELDRKRGLNEVDYTRACRPFGENCGFILAEASQYFVLFDDELVLELGANIYGSVGDIFVNADGFKRSISSPGFGNYITMAKAAASVRAILGADSLKNRSFIQSHGTGTPQNRVTESHVLNEIAKAYHIEDWMVSAVKCYVGHPLGPAAGDQIMSTLGIWKYGIVPGIFTLDEVADDVHQSNLKFSREHTEIDKSSMDSAFINSKGFGGNNATGVMFSPDVTRKMLEKKHGQQVMKKHAEANEAVREQADVYDQAAIRGEASTIYNFGKNVVSGEDLNLTDTYISIPGCQQKISLDFPSVYPDMTLSED